jgi:hypothetical protein
MKETTLKQKPSWQSTPILGRLLSFLNRRKNLLMALLLLAANTVAWFSVASRVELVEAEPILHPEIAEIRNHWNAGDAVGESFSIVVTDQMAMETVAWFIEPRANLPFSHPQIEIHPESVTGGGLVYFMGMRTPVFGRATIYLEDGKPQANIEEIGVAGTKAPAFVLEAVKQGQAIYDQLSMPIEITTLDLREGEVLVEGVYR